jgi:hypothetical protein
MPFNGMLSVLVSVFRVYSAASKECERLNLKPFVAAIEVNNQFEQKTDFYFPQVLPKEISKARDMIVGT